MMPRGFLRCTAAALALLALPCRADEAGPPTETRIRLRVRPAAGPGAGPRLPLFSAAPVPALRYLLLPEHRELNPGNPCFGYSKCFLEQQRFFFDKEAVRRRETL